jgi:hypothetical protein
MDVVSICVGCFLKENGAVTVMCEWYLLVFGRWWQCDVAVPRGAGSPWDRGQTVCE